MGLGIGLIKLFISFLIVRGMYTQWTLQSFRYSDVYFVSKSSQHVRSLMCFKLHIYVLEASIDQQKQAVIQL